MWSCCSDCFGTKEEPDETDTCKHCEAKKKFAKLNKKSKDGKNAFGCTSIGSFQKLYSRKASQDRLVPYTFRIPANISHFREMGPRRAKCPPFHLLLDHVVAVVWCLFSTDARDKKHLGISQLEWALYFLRGVKNNTGKHPLDVAIAIRTIEDTLMKSYAAMSKLVLRQEAQKKAKASCEVCERKDLTPKSICGICTNASLAFLPRKSKSTTYNSNKSMDSHMESILNASPQFSSTRNVYDTPGNQMYPSTKKGYYKKPANQYSRLSKKAHRSSGGLQNNIVELKTLIAQLSDNDLFNNTESDDAMFDLLRGFRQHQVTKIREQMRNLQSIETLLYRDRSDFASSLLNTTSADT